MHLHQVRALQPPGEGADIQRMTPNRLTGEALRRSEERLSELLRHSSDMIVVRPRGALHVGYAHDDLDTHRDCDGELLAKPFTEAQLLHAVRRALPDVATASTSSA